MSIIFKTINTIWSRKIFRFACIGVINTLFDITILNTLVFLFGLVPLLANLISASISITMSYFLNHHIVFREKHPHSIDKFIKFFLITGISILALQSLTISLVTHILGANKTIIYRTVVGLGLTNLSVKFVNLNTAKIIAVIIGMSWNYLFYKKIVFKTHINIEDNLVSFRDEKS